MTTNIQQERTNLQKEIEEYHKYCDGSCGCQVKARLSQHDKTMKLVMEEIGVCKTCGGTHGEWIRKEDLLKSLQSSHPEDKAEHEYLDVGTSSSLTIKGGGKSDKPLGHNIDKSEYGMFPCIKCGKKGLRFKNNPCSKCKRKKLEETHE